MGPAVGHRRFSWSTKSRSLVKPCWSAKAFMVSVPGAIAGSCCRAMYQTLLYCCIIQYIVSAGTPARTRLLVFCYFYCRQECESPDCCVQLTVFKPHNPSPMALPTFTASQLHNLNVLPKRTEHKGIHRRNNVCYHVRTRGICSNNNGRKYLSY